MPAYPSSGRLLQLATGGWMALMTCIALWSTADIAAQQVKALNTTLVGSVQVEEPWDPDGGEYFTTTDLYVAGDYAYMGSSNHLLHIVDISDPAAMRLVASLDMPGPALDVKVSGDLAVVAIQGAANTKLGVVVVDISDRHNPRILSEFANPFWFGVHNLFLYQNRAYLAHSASRGLTVLNLEDPTQPFISGSWINDEEKFGSIIHDVFIRDGMAFLSDIVSGIGGLVTLDLTDPDHPLTLSSLSIPEGVHNAWKEGNYVYCNQEFGGWQQPLHIIDIADPHNPIEVGTLRAQHSAVGDAIGPHSIWVEDGLLYWSYYDGGLRIFDLADPVRPVEIGYYHTPYAWGSQPHDDGLIYVADARLSAVRALRFTAPAYAVRSASRSPSSLRIGDETTIDVQAAIAPFRPGISGSIRQVTARLLPDRINQQWALHDDGTAGDEVGGDGLFSGRMTLPADLRSGQYHLEILVEDDSGRVYPYSNLPLTLFPSADFEILDEQWSDDIQVEIERGASMPRFIDSGPVFRGALAGAFAVQAESAQGWEVRLQFAEAFELLGYAKLRFAFHPGDATGQRLNLNLDDIHFHMAEGRSRPFWQVDLDLPQWQEVEIPFDLLQRQKPTLAAIVFSGDLAGTFYIDDMRLVIEAGPSTEVFEERETTPQTMTLSQNWPNPFNSETQIRFTLRQSTEMDLSIFNLAGQQVATLYRGRRAAGIHTLRWDSRDDLGNALASGMYIYRLQVGEQKQTHKLLLLR